MKVISLSPTAWESNSYLLIENGEALRIDAGAPTHRVAELLEKEKATLCGILLTHGHFDHILSIDLLRERYGAPVYVHKDDAPMLTDGNLNAYATFFRENRAWQAADKLLKGGDTVSFGEKKIRVLHTPGHTKGSVCYCVDALLFGGDTLFADGYGRTDLEGGSYEELTRSLGTLFALSPSLTVYPGHGGTATLEQIKRNLGF